MYPYSVIKVPRLKINVYSIDMGPMIEVRLIPLIQRPTEHDDPGDNKYKGGYFWQKMGRLWDLVGSSSAALTGWRRWRFSLSKAVAWKCSEQCVLGNSEATHYNNGN